MTTTSRFSRRTLAIGAGTAAALALAVPAWATLPQRATLKGSTSNGGLILFKVDQHEIVLMQGGMPTRSADKCLDALKGKTTFKIPNKDRIGNGRFSINALQTTIHHDGTKRRVRLRISGLFSANGRRGSGSLRLAVHDKAGLCDSGSLGWHIPRS